MCFIGVMEHVRWNTMEKTIRTASPHAPGHRAGKGGMPNQRRNPVKKLIPAVLLTLIATTALAMAPSFTQVDTNKDGAISASEAEAAGISKELFAKADADHSGSLNVDEFKNLSVQGK